MTTDYRSRRVPIPSLPPAVAMTTFDEARTGYTRAQAHAEATRGLAGDFVASRAACPFGIDIEEMVRAIAASDFDAARATIERVNPWPAILGRCCKAYCEPAQRVPDDVEPLALKELERAAGTFGRRTPFEMPAPTGSSVAIVGGGTAGVAVARGLRTRGHAVVLMERLPRTGGMMAVGYPAFRLPEHVLDEEVDPEELGVDVRTGVDVTREMIGTLLEQYDAVVLTTGQSRAVPLDVPGAQADGVHEALNFLTAFRIGAAPRIGTDAIVVGGGNTAADVARTLRRLGSDVRILFRRGPDDLRVRPARRAWFIGQLAEEGIPIDFWTAVRRIRAHNGRIVSVELERTDGAEEPSPYPCDLLVAAIGEGVDDSILPSDVVTSDGLVVVDEEWMTSVPGLFAVGEVSTGPHGTDQAFAAGLRAAGSIDRYLRRGKDAPVAINRAAGPAPG